MPKANCHRCRFFRITWEERLRYACEGFGFRSTRLPSVVVRETSGQDCTLFQAKSGTPPATADE